MITRPSWGTSMTPSRPVVTRAGFADHRARQDPNAVADHGEKHGSVRAYATIRPISTPGPITALATITVPAPIRARRTPPRWPKRRVDRRPRRMHRIGIGA
jgi:hypothetical protein